MVAAPQGQQVQEGGGGQGCRRFPVQQQLQTERGERICERNSADTRASEEEEEVDAPGDREYIPQQPVVETAVPPQPMEVHCLANIHLKPVEDPTREQL